MNITIDHARLASRRPRHSGDLPKAHRTRVWRADVGGTLLSVAVPGPAALASYVSTLGYHRNGRALQLADGTPVAHLEAIAALAAALAVMPDDADAEEPYQDLRRAALYPGPLFAAYVADVAREWVKLVPRVPRPPRSAPEDRAPAMTSAERVRLHRDRKRREERESAEWVLRTFLADDDDGPAPVVGARIAGSDLYGYGTELLEGPVYDYDDSAERGEIDDWLEGRDDLYAPGCPARPRMISRQVLYAAATDMGLHVTRARGGIVIRIFRRLKESLVKVLQLAADLLGDTRSPEEFDADTLEAIGAPVAPEPDPALEALAAALPGAVASAMASSDDPLRSLELVGAYWARRHPETRDAIVAAHRAFSPALVEHVRFLVASAIEADV